MKILVVSDTHGHEANLRKVLEKIGKIDHLIHCGDVEEHEAAIEEMAGCPCTFVRGNNDYGTNLNREEIVTFGNYRIFVTHGHTMGVHWDYDGVRQAARKKNCNVAMFGHTHRPVVEIAPSENGVTLINPGSLTFPRQDGRKPSFVTMEIDRFGKAHYTLCYLNRGDRFSFW